MVGIKAVMSIYRPPINIWMILYWYLVDSSSGVIIIFCLSVQIFLSPLSRQQFLRDFMAALASLMRERDCTECLFDIFLQKIDFLSGWLCYKFLWATVWYMWVLSNTNHFIQQSTVMPLTVDQYSADTCCVNWVLTSLVWHVVECRSTCWPISWSSCQVIVNRHILSRGVPKWQGYFAERWTLNAECWTTLKFCD